MRINPFALIDIGAILQFPPFGTAREKYSASDRERRPSDNQEAARDDAPDETVRNATHIIDEKEGIACIQGFIRWIYSDVIADNEAYVNRMRENRRWRKYNGDISKPEFVRENQ